MVDRRSHALRKAAGIPFVTQRKSSYSGLNKPKLMIRLLLKTFRYFCFLRRNYKGYPGKGNLPPVVPY
jgi:hypothetical protein